MKLFRAMLISVFTLLPIAAAAQGFKVAFGDLQQDTALPVEVTADSLSVNQNDGSAVFEGTVAIVQGEMRMTADKVNVHYHPETRGIARLLAEGNVLIVQGADAAEAQKADYSIEDGTILMTGAVTLIQTTNTITADTMRLNLADNTAQMTGRVKTILRTE